MSQYMPNTAISSALERMPRGSALHGGSPATRSENSPSLLSSFTAPAAVPEHEIEHRRRHDHRPDRAADHLPDLAPPTGGAPVPPCARIVISSPPCRVTPDGVTAFVAPQPYFPACASSQSARLVKPTMIASIQYCERTA